MGNGMNKDEPLEDLQDALFEIKQNIRRMGINMSKILCGVYVGNIRDSKDKAQQADRKITHILSIHGNASKVLPDKVYMCIDADDNANQDLSQFFPACNDFIHQARIEGGNVLIHCLAGVSRSVTVTVAYIMTITNLGWRDALNAVRGARNCANPNFGFQRQLLNFEHEQLKGERERLLKKFGPCPYDDLAQCTKLLEAHRHWVLHGDEAPEEDTRTYPLPHKAYSERDKPAGEPVISEKSAQDVNTNSVINGHSDTPQVTNEEDVVDDRVTENGADKETPQGTDAIKPTSIESVEAKVDEIFATS